ncbi:hypothetical protein CK203_061151 [Vitis vinifera]|uniref:Retrotransposon gag domain-containing protein n=1 Tax=Vitis vinifera TaxID=29760 RepID=A0A438GC75_VITVI|nr:hypothetical protein CK203_061151 [Vitis vinifera]
MCRGDDHLAWKRPVSLEACRGLRTAGGESVRSWLSPKSHSWRRVGGRLIRVDSYQSSDSSIEMLDELASTLASIKEVMTGFLMASQTAQALLPRVSLGTPFHLADHYETIPPPTITVPPPMVPTIDDEGLTWDDRDDPFETIQHGHESTRIDDAQLVALFPMSLSGVAQIWFASVESSRLCTWEDVAHEFLTQFAFNASIDVSRRELEATRQRLDESISSFLVHVAFSVKEAIARGLWTNTTPSPDSKRKKPFGSSSRPGKSSFLSSAVSVSAGVCSGALHCSDQHTATTTTSESHYSPPPRPYAQWPIRQFTPLGITLTRAFEKLKDGGLIVPLVPRPLPHPIPPHFCSHEHCLYHQIQGHDTEHCSVLHYAIQDLIDSGLVNLAGLSVTTNPLPTHSTHAIPPPPSL